MVQEETKVLHQEPGLTVEEVKALYFKKDAIIGQPMPIYRLDNGKLKFYYTWDEEEFIPNFYLSVTSFTDANVPKDPGLIEWMVSMGPVEYKKYVSERKHYGMLMDEAFGHFLISGNISLDQIEGRVYDYCAEKHLFVQQELWVDELKKDILSFAQWLMDYNVEPLGIQMMLASDENGLSGRLDLRCNMDSKNYTEKTPPESRKRHAAIVDYKSGKSGNFYLENEIQLGCYRDIWNFNFPDDPVECIYNWSGKNWRTRPGYHFKNQTGARSLDKIPHYLEIAELDKQTTPMSKVNIISGNVTKGNAIDSNFRVFDPVEYVRNLMTERL